ncbi:hypothetical protein LR48_Vigan07g190800 [Vigna angularis]|uniref:Uncharacterized protein n=1 Tax=Phaseolus angularis TaxID=3914 RepID=A0A0L9V099_PHAAN|nr:hypothetical protein LR48_Vigan07g190800 [Vigna angularis]
MRTCHVEFPLSPKLGFRLGKGLPPLLLRHAAVGEEVLLLFGAQWFGFDAGSDVVMEADLGGILQRRDGGKRDVAIGDGGFRAEEVVVTEEGHFIVGGADGCEWCLWRLRDSGSAVVARRENDGGCSVTAQLRQGGGSLAVAARQGWSSVMRMVATAHGLAEAEWRLGFAWSRVKTEIQIVEKEYDNCPIHLEKIDYLTRTLAKFTQGKENLDVVLRLFGRAIYRQGIGYKAKSNRINSKRFIDMSKPTTNACFYYNTLGHNVRNYYFRNVGVSKGKYKWVPKEQPPPTNKTGPKFKWVPASKPFNCFTGKEQ